MTPERYQIISDIFAEAQELPRDERTAFVREKCGGDEDLRAEVESLLASDADSGDFIETPAMEIAAEMLAASDTKAKIGRAIAQYKIVSLIGAGGMGEVWLAEDAKLKRRVALKLLSGVRDHDRLLRFEQEAFAVSALNHPNIITIYDIGESDGLQFIATEYIEGKTLRQLLKEKDLTTAQAVEIAVEICAALSTAHQAGIIHRDIKPENIMVRRDGIVKILDFGLARFNEKKADSAETRFITKPGMILGTILYMSPEQARALPLDEKTDIFSLGVVLYEMLAGKLPFDGETDIDYLAALIERPPHALDADMPAELKKIVAASLEKSPSKRLSAAEMLNGLRDVKRGLEFSHELQKHNTSDNLNDAQTVEMTAVTGGRFWRRAKTTENSSLRRKGSFRPQIYYAAAFLLMVAVGAGAYFQFFAKKKYPAVLSETDKVLVADFENKTGDEDFDGTLRQPFAVSLAQSPYFMLISEGQVRQTLKLMEKKPDEVLTVDVAREVCQRLGLKAFLKGTLENHGVEYKITLEAFKTETGESLAREETGAKSKEAILDSLNKATAEIREKLGESIASIERFDTPIQNATTASLEALKLYTMATKNMSDGKNDEAVTLLKRAVAVDPNFALAYASLGTVYYNKNQFTSAAEYAEKAYTLRDRTTEREKLRIADFYYAAVTGESDKNIEILELFRQTYPRDIVPPVNLSAAYTRLGKFAKSEENARVAISLDPQPFIPYANLGKALNSQSKFDESKAVFEDMLARKFDSPQINTGLFTVAFVKGDEPEMQRQIEELKKKEPDTALLMQGNPLIYAGKWREYVRVLNQAIDEAAKAEMPEVAADYAAQVAVNAAALGKCSEAKIYAERALKFDREQAILTDAAFSLTLCGENAAPVIAELKEKYPKNTLVNSIWLPIIRAAAELETSPERAVETLEINRRFEGASYFWDNYLRGKAYLKLKKPDEAAAEFQKILQNRGWAVQSPLNALAQMELARAFSMQADNRNAQKYLEAFGVMWKNADAEIQALKDAKQLTNQAK